MSTPQSSERGIEELSEQVHHLYCSQYEKDHGEPYWTKGDYSRLDERVKEYDRNIARWHHQELQKARADWLRSEIEKVEGIGYEREDSLISPLESHRHNDIEYGFELARTSIITRYKEELKVLESK